MHIELSAQAPGGEGERGAVTVGWLLTKAASAVLFDAPERVRGAVGEDLHAKSAARCPAVVNFETRFFAVKCPYDLNLAFQRTKDGEPALKNLMRDKSAVRQNRMAQIIKLTDEREWRHPERPMFQMALPYLFVADEPVWLNQLPPFMHFRKTPLPGLTIGGRFPLHVWPRPLMWAFEWHDIEAPLILKRGEPLFYAQFETQPQDRNVRLVEAELTDELARYVDEIGGVVNYVNQTFSLFEAAEERRPARLVRPVER